MKKAQTAYKGCLRSFLLWSDFLLLWIVLRDPHQQIREITVEGLTDLIQIFKIHTIAEFVIHLINRCTSDSRYPGKLCLCPSPLTKASRQ